MNELLSVVAHEVGSFGVDVDIALDRFPDAGGTTYVVVPHEYFATVPQADHPSDEQLQRTIALCVEQPGNSWFEFSLAHARRTAAVVDIDRSSARELQRRGVPAEHFQLGYSEYWDRWHRDQSVERPVDVLHLGTESARRRLLLAGYASTLWPLENRLLVAPVAPKPEPRADFLVGEEKWLALRSAKALLNIHRDATPYFEWVRVLEAIANGCVVVSEPSNDVGPLVPGEHFVSDRVESLALLASGLLRDDDRVRTIRSAAYDFVRSELPMGPAVQRLVGLAERSTSDVRRRKPVTGSSDEAAALAEVEDTDTAGRVVGADSAREARMALKRLRLAEIEVTRLLEQVELRLGGLDPDAVEVVATTRAYARASPRVSALVPLYNHALEVRQALRSIAASDYESVEIVVLDDGSKDDSVRQVLGFFERRPELPGVLLRHVGNRGLGATRNDLAAHARGEFVLMLDADNEVYPTAISRLVRALDRIPSAFFAYPMLEVHENGVPWTLLSYLPWEPGRLRAANYIDALALLRRRELLDIGGYTEDLRLYGLEDWDLWCRCADRDLEGVLVPQILARYAHSLQSMRSITSLDLTEAEEALRASYPRLMGSESQVSDGGAQRALL